MSEFNTPYHRERAAEVEQWAQIIQHKITADYLYPDDESDEAEVTPAGFRASTERKRRGLVVMLPPAVCRRHTSAITTTSFAAVFRNNLCKNLHLFLKTKLARKSFYETSGCSEGHEVKPGDKNDAIKSSWILNSSEFLSKKSYFHTDGH